MGGTSINTIKKEPFTLEQLTPYTWEVSKNQKQGMLVPARIYATQKLLEGMDLQVFDQITNVACLPGIQFPVMAMADAHSGYGAPVGAVFATDPKEEGVISPGAVGYDINCSMKVLRTNLDVKEVRPKIQQLIDILFKTVSPGVGAKSTLKLSKNDLDDISTEGVKWCLDNGLAWESDKSVIEENGKIKGANIDKVSDMAKQRGLKQIGTLGSGNHYLEIQYIASPDHVYDKETAKVYGVSEPGQVAIMWHCGSRGFGHQICTDYSTEFVSVMKKQDITVKDRQLACARFDSQEGQDYFEAMKCAINFSYVNKQVITHRVREAFEKVFGKTAEEMGMDAVYDVAHNTAKLEKYKVDGKTKQLVVHRKGATRSFGPGNPEIPLKYQKVGQPVIVGGSMETGSYLLAGTKKAEEETFGSTLHGAGRVMSRTQAAGQFKGETLQKNMAARGIFVKSVSMSGLAEEAGLAYKDLESVVDCMEGAGISKRVTLLTPIANIKG